MTYDVMYGTFKSNMQKNVEKIVLKVNNENSRMRIQIRIHKSEAWIRFRTKSHRSATLLSSFCVEGRACLAALRGGGTFQISSYYFSMVPLEAEILYI